MAKLRTCKICGKQYEYCGHCPSKNLIEPWRNLYCSEGCRDAFEVMGKYTAGKMTAIQAKEKLEEFGIKPGLVRDIHKGVVVDIFRASQPKVESVQAILRTDPNPIIDAKNGAGEPIPTFSPESDPVLKERSYKRKRNFEKKDNNIVNED